MPLSRSVQVNAKSYAPQDLSALQRVCMVCSLTRTLCTHAREGFSHNGVLEQESLCRSMTKMRSVMNNREGKLFFHSPEC
jgi:hypothetical protein